MRPLQRSVLVFLVILPALFFPGCAPKVPTASTPVVVTWKARGLALNDTAFLDRFDGFIRLRIYSAGMLAFEVTVNEQVCAEGLCMDGAAFNERYLHKSYPADTVKRLLEGLPPAFPDGGLVETEGRTVYRAEKAGEYDVTWTAEPGLRLFRDTANKILIRIKDL